MPPKNRITDRTWVPLGLAVVALGGGGGWVTVTSFQLSDLGREQASMKQMVKEVRDDVIVLKTVMGVTGGREEPEDSEYSSSNSPREDFEGLRERIRSARTDYAPNFGAALDRGAEADLGHGSRPGRKSL